MNNNKNIDGDMRAIAYNNNETVNKCKKRFRFNIELDTICFHVTLNKLSIF